MRSTGLACLALICSITLHVRALDNGLGIKPPMAWSNWNIVGGKVNETFIKQQADRLVSSGLAGVGYNYIIVDDNWSALERTAEGALQANSTTFPSGMKALGDYLHSKDLKFGIYSDAGNLTCQFHPGSRGHEDIDAQTFADWGVDYLKYDNCHAPAEDWVVDRYAAMSLALNRTGRPIVYSIVGWGVGDPWLGWGAQYGNSWRTDGDITASWEAILRVLDDSVGLMRYSQPQGWADMDMLEVGVGYLTLQEQRSHFALWALMKSPLMLGADLTTLSKEQLDIVSAPEVIAVNQDDLGVAGDLVWKEGPSEVYAGPLSDGSRAVVLLNRHTLATQYPLSNISVRWEWLGFPQDAKATVRDLFNRKDAGSFVGSFTAQVNIHDAVMLKVTLSDDASAYNDWRPWNARSYAPAANNSLSPLAIAIVVAVALTCVLALALLVYIARGVYLNSCRRFERLGGDTKKRRSPSGRLQDIQGI